MLGAIYGQTSGDGLKNLAALRRRFPQAVAYVDDAARAGRGGPARTDLAGPHLPAGRPGRRGRGGGGGHPARTEAEAGPPRPAGRWTPGYASTNARARGRFTRNFVVQGSAADWALLLLAALRQALRRHARPSWSSSSTTR